MRLGYRLDIVANGKEALEALERQTYDVILMDIQMPEMDGLEATRLIRQHLPPARQPHIIAMTAEVLQGVREECRLAGMNDYITKPVRIEELVYALGQADSLPEQELHHLSQTGNLLHDEPPFGSPQALLMEQQTYIEPDEPAIDFDVLEQLRDMMDEVAYEIINIYLEDSPQQLAQMRQALKEEDSQLLYRAAHTLKPTSSSLGAMNLATLCEELEEMARNQQLHGAAEKVKLIEAEYQRVEVALKRF